MAQKTRKCNQCGKKSPLADTFIYEVIGNTIDNPELLEKYKH